MTEIDIIKHLAGWIDTRKYPFQLCNAFIYEWECDYWAMDAAGITREFEIKISRSDYQCDAKKGKHQGDNGANYFYYVVPKDLIKVSEVDKRYGLIYVREGGYVEVVKKPRQLHRRKFESWQALATKMYWRFYALWKEKYVAKEITHEQYRQGFLLEDIETDLTTVK